MTKAPMQLSPLMKLPLELHYEILSHLDLDDHLSAVSVCPLWQKILTSSTLRNRRLNSYTRSLCSGKWFIVNSILRSGKLKVKMTLAPAPKWPAVVTQFFWKFGQGDYDCFEITDSKLLDEAALTWPVDTDSGLFEHGVIYGTLGGLTIDDYYLQKRPIFQKMLIGNKEKIIKIRDLVICSVQMVVFPLLSRGATPKGFRNSELFFQIMDARLERSAVNLTIHSKRE
ncbi:hypothetical protein TWF718_009956 [Orbilia javanica]|uniref:F-box domain-containing protein n=1 Tax=Orbilia javanica TaxID=47235 RepID=A0AAN8MQI9_9PEZI